MILTFRACGLLCVLLLGSLSVSWGQVPDSVWRIREVAILGISEEKTAGRIRKEARKVKSETDLQDLRTKWAQEQEATGRLEFSLEEYVHAGESLTLIFHQGPIYAYEALRLDGLSETYRQKSGLGQLLEKEMPINWADLEGRLRYCLDLYQDEGYPFAAFDRESVTYQPISPDSMGAAVAYTFDPGPLIVIDSVNIVGNHRERDEFVRALTRIRPGEPYRQRLISDAPRLLNNSIYYERVPNPAVSFTSWNTAKVKLKLQRKRAGKFDLLVGLLPPDETNDRLQFTGTVDIVFVSPFRMGEILQFKYDKLTSTSNRLDIEVLIPHIFQTPFQVEGELSILKQEEDFQNRFFRMGGEYAFSPFFAASFNYRNRNSSLLDITEFENDTLQGPPQLDGTQQLYGVGFTYEKLDYRLNPTKGLSFEMEVRLGKRSIRENFRLPGEIYDDLPAELPAREVEFAAHWYKQVLPRQVVHLAQHTYWLGQERVFRNDQLQVGGARSIRGFNENQFFTNFYTFFTAEYRLLLERDSYLVLFGDYAYLENAVDNEINRPLGIGLGMNYGTSAGVISISYGIGKTKDIPFQPSRGKVHIGFINQF